MKIFKKLIAVIALTLVAIPTFAQEDSVVFNPHWELQLQVGAGHTIGETSFTDLISPAAAIYIGREFTPVVGARIGVSGFQGRGGFDSYDEAYKYNYLQGNLDLVINLANWFGGYKYDRTVSPYLFAGAGFNYAFNNDEATALYNSGVTMGNYWADNSTSFVGRLGLGVDFRVSEKVAINLEANSNVLSDNFNSKNAPTPDWQLNLVAGLTIKLGKSTKTVAKAKQVEPAPAPAPKPAPKPEPKPEPKKETPKPAPKKVVVEPQTFNVFFTIDSSKITTEGDNTIDDVVAYMNANPTSTVALTGYADVKTGNESINTPLSQRRSEAVAAALTSKGIASSRIVTDYKGDTEQPFSENAKNRVVICIVK